MEYCNGADRTEFYNNLLEGGFTPEQVSTQFTIPQMVALFSKAGEELKMVKELAKQNSEVLKEYYERIKRTEKCD